MAGADTWFWNEGGQGDQGWIKVTHNQKVEWENNPKTDPVIIEIIKNKQPNERIERVENVGDCSNYSKFKTECVSTLTKCPEGQQVAFCCHKVVERKSDKWGSADGSFTYNIYIKTCQCYHCVPKCPAK